MNGPANDIQQKQALFHSHHDYTACYPDSFCAESTSSSTDSSPSLQIELPHLRQNSSMNNDTLNPSINRAHSDNVITPTEPKTTSELAQVVEHAPAGDIGQSDSAVEQISVKVDGEALLEQVNGQIELLEDSSDGGVPSGESSLMVEESQEWVPNPDHELKRVKVRILDFLFSNEIYIPSATACRLLRYSIGPAERPECLNFNTLIHISRSTNLSVNVGWIREQPSVLDSFLTKETRPSSFHVQSGTTTISF